MSNILHYSVGALHQRPIQLRVKRTGRVVGKAKLAHVANHTNHSQRHPGALGRILIEIKNADVFADRILTRKILPCKTAVDHRDPTGVLIVRVADETSPQKRNSHGLQIFRLDDVIQCEWQVCLTRSRLLSLGYEGGFSVPLHRIGAPLQ